MHGVHLDQVDNVSRALKPAETDLLWNFLVEVALNSDDTQRKRLHDELSPGLANVQVCARACDSSFATATDVLMWFSCATSCRHTTPTQGRSCRWKLRYSRRRCSNEARVLRPDERMDP